MSNIRAILVLFFDNLVTMSLIFIYTVKFQEYMTLLTETREIVNMKLTERKTCKTMVKQEWHRRLAKLELSKYLT